MDHLLHNICEVALLPVEQRIARLRSEYWIGYTRAQEALSKMEELLNINESYKAMIEEYINFEKESKLINNFVFQKKNSPFIFIIFLFLFFKV